MSPQAQKLSPLPSSLWLSDGDPLAPPGLELSPSLLPPSSPSWGLSLGPLPPPALLEALQESSF